MKNAVTVMVNGMTFNTGEPVGLPKNTATQDIMTYINSESIQSEYVLFHSGTAISCFPSEVIRKAIIIITPYNAGKS